MADKELWQWVVEQVTNWLTAIGTVGAVVVSLYLARRDARVILEIGAGHRIMMPGVPGQPVEEYISFSATNVGRRPATISYVGWRFGNRGRFSRYFAFGAKFSVQLLENLSGSQIPATLQDGEAWTYLHSFDGWAKQIAEDVLKPPTIRKARTIHLHIVTSTGRHFFARIEPGLQKRLVEYAKGVPLKLGD